MMKKIYIYAAGFGILSAMLLNGCSDKTDSDTLSIPSEISEAIPGTENGGDGTTKDADAIMHNYSVTSLKPNDENIDIENVPDGTYPVEFLTDTLSSVQSGFTADFKIYTVDVYDTESVKSLEEGDKIVINGEEIPVTSVRESEGQIILNDLNGSDIEDSYIFGIDEDGTTCRIMGEDDYSTYTYHGKVTIPIASNVLFQDGSDFSTFPDTTIVAPDDLISYLTSTSYSYFTEYNTTIRIVNGQVVNINRVYTP